MEQMTFKNVLKIMFQENPETSANVLHVKIESRHQKHSDETSFFQRWKISSRFMKNKGWIQFFKCESEMVKIKNVKVS